MAPPRGDVDFNTGLVHQAETDHKETLNTNEKVGTKIVWRNVILMSAVHIGAVYGIYELVMNAKLYTWLWTFLLYFCSGLGITAGAHRLWAHRSYKASWPIRFILMIFNSIALQNDVIEWSRDHRVHHKYSETDADPHNAKRGFFFSHVGWLLVRKHPDVSAKGRKLDVADLLADPILAFQRRFYIPLVISLCFVMPTVVPLIWGETLWVAYFTAAILRYCLVLNSTWMVNSIAHMYGNRPYDKTISPRQNIPTAMLTMGEGWHNYHHTFPQDYRTSEYPWRLNATTLFIDFCARLGLASDLKTISAETIMKKKLRTAAEH
jgi:stearoyl-CoA desaturase (delta-9 desaturase)